jgi:hypothetical protein
MGHIYRRLWRHSQHGGGYYERQNCRAESFRSGGPQRLLDISRNRQQWLDLEQFRAFLKPHWLRFIPAFRWMHR